jgi:hypothetical protein
MTNDDAVARVLVCEARLTSLRSRRQRWLNRYAEIANTRAPQTATRPPRRRAA